MKTTLIFVSTLDGKVTKWGDSRVALWSSKEDQNYFKSTWHQSKVIVMGSKTFDANPLPPSPNHLLIVMTSHPDNYKQQAVPGQIEFTPESPRALADRFKREEHMLVVGGPHVATSFLKEQLVDELWLTLEPRIFGIGGNIVSEEELDIDLRLLHSEQVNEKGTFINKYEVMKNGNPPRKDPN